MQVQYAGAFAAGAAYVEKTLLIEQLGKTLRGVLHGPWQDQVVVAGVDVAIAAQGLVQRGQRGGRHQRPGQVQRAHSMDQRFLDRVIAVQRRGGVDGQGGIGPYGGVQRAEHRLEQFRGKRLEQGLVTDRQTLLTARTLRFLEQREIAKRLPQCAAGAVAQQQGVARVALVECWPGGEVSVRCGHAGSVGRRGKRGRL
ncbi:hypothetical protein D3C76_1012970 [compost metagenome]